MISRRGTHPWPFNNFRKKARGGTPIAPGLHEDIDHVTVLVHSPPEILPLPLDGHKEFVQVPRVAQAASPAPQPPSVVEPERLTPLPNRFIRHGDTPFGEEIFNISETQAEAMVEPDGVTDDLGRKAVSVVAESRGRHRPTLSAARQLDNAILPISPPIADALNRRRARRDSDSPLVFHHDGITIRRWRTAWRTACQAAGVPTRFLHDCRRTAARNLIPRERPRTGRHAPDRAQEPRHLRPLQHY